MNKDIDTTPRPMAIDRETYEKNWDRAFKNPDVPHPIYLEELNSGMFFEWHPDLTGKWKLDKTLWKQRHNVSR